jgi:hypothetical protein
MNSNRPKRTRKKSNNQDGNPISSIKHLVKEKSPDKYCECGGKIECWKEKCTKCYFDSKVYEECMF